MSESKRVEQSFATILERARAVDQDALALLYDRYLTPVYQFVLSRVGDIHLAEDITAETFMGMVERIEHVRARDELAFAGWLFGIARNKVAEHFRRQEVRRRMTVDAPEQETRLLAAMTTDDPLGVVVARERWAEVVAALNKLTEEQRSVLLYRCVLGYETDDVAQLMGRQTGAIRALQFRALDSLARHLSAGASNPALVALRATRPRSAPDPLSRRSDDATRS